VAIVFLIAPTALVLLTSFTSSPALKFPPPGYSLRWYAALLDAEQMQQAAWNSLLVALWATAVSVVFGTAGALAIAGLAVTLVASTLRSTRRLYQLERLDPSAKTRPSDAGPRRS